MDSTPGTWVGETEHKGGPGELSWGRRPQGQAHSREGGGLVRLGPASPVAAAVLPRGCLDVRGRICAGAFRVQGLGPRKGSRL